MTEDRAMINRCATHQSVPYQPNHLPSRLGRKPHLATSLDISVVNCLDDHTAPCFATVPKHVIHQGVLQGWCGIDEMPKSSPVQRLLLQQRATCTTQHSGVILPQ